MKEIDWIGSSKKDVIACPEEVKDAIGYALELAQRGLMARKAERMKGDLRNVLELRVSDKTGDSTFRATYTTTIGDVVYVLDVFKKKSKMGSETPKPDLDRIRARLRMAQEKHENRAKIH